MKNRKELIKEIQEIKRRLRLVEKSAAGLKKAKKAPPEEALKRKFPALRVDPELLKCVGIDPPLSLRREKQALRDAIDVFYESK
jgi:hypothetical protein